MRKLPKFGILLAGILGLVGLALPALSFAGGGDIAGIKFVTDSEKILPILFFAPSLALVVLGAVGVIARRFPRRWATIGLVLGLAGVVLYALVRGDVGETEGANLAIGAHLAGIGGVLAIASAIAGLSKPDIGFRRKGKRFKATISSKPPQL